MTVIDALATFEALTGAVCGYSGNANGQSTSSWCARLGLNTWVKHVQNTELQDQSVEWNRIATSNPALAMNGKSAHIQESIHTWKQKSGIGDCRFCALLCIVEFLQPNGYQTPVANCYWITRSHQLSRLCWAPWLSASAWWCTRPSLCSDLGVGLQERAELAEIVKINHQFQRAKSRDSWNSWKTRELAATAKRERLCTKLVQRINTDIPMYGTTLIR